MPEKLYAGDLDFYARKLAKVMERFGIDQDAYNWDCNRHGAFVEFHYKDGFYRFDQTVEKARTGGQKMNFGSDAFAQIVLTLEDLARMVERGIYDLSTWVSGMKMLPPVVEVPTFFRQLGFTEIPSDVEEVRARYRTLTKQLHPDAGGAREDYEVMVKSAEQATAWFGAGGGSGR
jgi:hypothetical protein